MNPNLHHLFASKFYINDAYAQSLVPSIIQNFTGVSFKEITEAELQKNIVSKIGAVASSDQEQTSNSKVVAILNFHQPVIKYSDGYSRWLGTQSYIRILEQLKNDPSIAGVVMDVDSGGGQVYGTPEFYEYIVSFTAVKPLVIYTGGYLCSGAYYFAAGASWIVAHSRADAIGSIGVYTILVDYKGFYEKYGITIHEIYASKSNKKNKNYRDVFSGKDADYKNFIKLELDPICDTFISDMKAVRPQIKEEAFEGGTWTGIEAVEMCLADENGTLETAIAKVLELSNKQASNKNSNKNQSKKTMSNKKTKAFPTIQGILGKSENGFSTISTVLGNKGIAITEEELGKIEAALSAKDKTIGDEKGKVTIAEGKVATIEGAVNKAITTAKLDADVAADATAETKIDLLGAKTVEYGEKAGAVISKSKSEGDQEENGGDAIANPTDAHNEIYNSL